VRLNTQPSNLFRFLKNDRVIILSIFSIAIIVRACYCWEISDTPFYSALIGDAGLFNGWAKEIASGKWAGDHVVLQPFYPYFLAVIYAIAGPNLFVVRVTQILIGALSCVVITRIGSEIFSKKTGVAAGFLLAFYPSAVFFDCLIQKSVFGVFFMSLLLLAISKTLHQPKFKWWFFSGAVLGLLVLARENAIILFPAIILWLIIYFRHQNKMRLLAWCSMFLAGFFIVFFPVAFKNMVNTGEFSVGASHFGPNFYMGNNPKAKGTYVPLAIGRGNIVSELEDIKKLAENSLGRKLTSSEASQYWTEKTLAYIESDPSHWARLLFKKWMLVWNFVEIGDTVDIYGHAHQSIILQVLIHIFHFGVLFTLFMVGICVTWKNRDRLWLFYLMLCAYAVGLTLFFVFARYRFPMITILILFAAAGIINIKSFLREQSASKIFLAGCIVFCASVISNWAIIPENISLATTYYNLGKAYEGSDTQDEAMKYYEAALKKVPDFPLAHNNLGILLINRGQYQQAINHFSRAVIHEPNFTDAQSNLGAALSEIGRTSEAIHHLKKALQTNPHDSGTHNNLGIVYYEERQFEKALIHFKEALRFEPDNISIAHNLKRVETLAKKPAASN